MMAFCAMAYQDNILLPMIAVLTCSSATVQHGRFQPIVAHPVEGGGAAYRLAVYTIYLI